MWTVIAALVGVGFLYAMSVQTVPAGSGIQNANVIEPAFTYAEIQELSRGQNSRTRGSLIAAILDSTDEAVEFIRHYPAEPVVTVKFASGRGLRSDTLHVGWPTTWVSRIDFSLYQDAVARTGQQPMRTVTTSDAPNVASPIGLMAANASLREDGLVWPRPRWSWGTYGGGWLAYRPTPEETNGSAVWIDFNTYGMIATVGFIVLGWAAPSLAIWIVNVIRGRKRPHWSGRRVKWAGVLVVLVITVWLTIRSASHTDTFTAPISPTVISTGLNGSVCRFGSDQSLLRLSDLQNLAARADGEQLLAQAILTATQPDSPSGEQYLAVALTPEVIIHNGSVNYFRGLPLVSIFSAQYKRRPEFGVAELLANPAGITWDFRYSAFRCRNSSGDPSRPETSTEVNLGAVGLLVMGCWILWLLSAMTCAIVTGVVARRRRQRNECIACGYALGPLRAS